MKEHVDPIVKECDERIEVCLDEIKKLEGNPDAESRIIELYERIKQITDIRSERIKSDTDKVDAKSKQLDSLLKILGLIIQGCGTIVTAILWYRFNKITRNMVMEFEETGTITGLVGKHMVNEIGKRI